MPWFHFNLYNDDTVIDEDGSELPDVPTARDAAIRSIRSIIASHVTEGLPIDLDHRIEITNRRGAVISVVTFGDAMQVVQSRKG